MTAFDNLVQSAQEINARASVVIAERDRYRELLSSLVDVLEDDVAHPTKVDEVVAEAKAALEAAS